MSFVTQNNDNATIHGTVPIIDDNLEPMSEPYKFAFENAVADPGFPVGGRAPIRGAWTSDMGAFSVKMCVKTKELGPIGEACARHAP